MRRLPFEKLLMMQEIKVVLSLVLVDLRKTGKKVKEYSLQLQSKKLQDRAMRLKNEEQWYYHHHHLLYKVLSL